MTPLAAYETHRDAQRDLDAVLDILQLASYGPQEIDSGTISSLMNIAMRSAAAMETANTTLFDETRPLWLGKERAAANAAASV